MTVHQSDLKWCRTQWRVALCWLLACVCGAATAQSGLTASQIGDFNALSQGLTTLATGSIITSRLHLYGTAIAVAVANDGGPIVSANRFGSGRVVHSGHEAMVTSCCVGTGLGGLVVNAVQWSAGSTTSGIRVAQYGIGMATVVKNLVLRVSCTSCKQKIPFIGHNKRAALMY
jgi:hypothetical protein